MCQDGVSFSDPRFPSHQRTRTDDDGEGSEQQHQDEFNLLEQHTEAELGNSAVQGRDGPSNLVHINNLGMMLHTEIQGRPL